MFNLKIGQHRNFMEPAITNGTVIPQGTYLREAGDPYNLQRFVDAQNPVFEEVCSELREGRKSGLWMQFIFPQIKDPGHSQADCKFAISSQEEAAAYLNHPILGPG